MEDKGRYDLLMVKYLAGELNEKERSFVRNLIRSDKVYAQYFSSLKKAWSLVQIENSLSSINIDLEWERFEKEMFGDKAKVISIAESLFNKNEEPEEQKKKSVFYKIIALVAVAASLFLILLFGSKFLSRDKTVVNEITKNTKTAVPFIRYEKNTTNEPKNLLLSDGSTIILYGKSEVRFTEPFIDERRDIMLDGKAFFVVAKDKTKPFTVFSDEIATTAVGTQFMVTSRDGDAKITVRLNEGKVVVRPVDKMNPGFSKELYLVPGQELVYDKKNKIARIVYFKPGNNTNVNIAVNKIVPDSNHPIISVDYKGSWFMFNNEPLNKIFDALEEIYDTKIIYSRSDLKKLYFIGTFNKGDSLENILQKIARLNDLKVTKEDSVFIIRNK